MKKHIMIGSLICVATVLIFLVFWGKLPNDVPIHFDSNGDVNSILRNIRNVMIVRNGSLFFCFSFRIFSK